MLLLFAGLQGAFAQCLSNRDDFSMQAVLPAAEYNALVAIYNATSGPGWTDKTGWVSGTYKAWAGVTVEGVAFIDVSEGGAPCYEVAQRGHVARLALGGNGLAGTVPAALGDLEFLQVLDLSGNALTGNIPASLGNLILLQVVHLQNNQFTGTIPAGLLDGKPLQVLNVSGNRFDAVLPGVPRALPFLKTLDASNSQVGGTIPANIGNLPFLSSIDVSGNHLEGEIPATLGELNLLEDLQLSANALCGDMPNSLSNLTQLASADLSNNQLTVNQAVVDAWTAQGTTVNINPQGLVLLNPATGVHGYQADTGFFDVITCAAWAAVSNDGWITIDSGGSGTGNGTVNYSVSLNDSGSPRSGTITVGDQAFTVNQGVQECTYGIAPTARAHASAGGSGSVTVTSVAGCPWAATANDAWITITSGHTGTGGGTVNYTVAENVSCNTRAGTITIAGETFTVNQDAGVLVVALNPVDANYPDAGGSGSFAVTASGQDCGWTAVSNDAWITVTGGAGGTGNGTVNYTVAVNGTGSPRTGTITAAGETFTVNQGEPNSNPIITEADPVDVVMSEGGVPTAFSLTLNATDIDSSTLTWSILTPASHGSASAAGTGLAKAIGYAPVAGYTGPDSFVVQVSDGEGGSDSITVQVSVQAAVHYDLVVVYNLISVPFTDSGLSTANDVLASIPNADALWFWDVATQRWVGQVLGGFNNYAIVPGSAYLVSVGQASTFDAAGYWATPSFTLKTGYNLVTLPKSKAALTTANAVLADIPNANTIWYWDAAAGQWKGQVLGGFNNFAVQVGRPYLVLVDADGTWPVPD